MALILIFCSSKQTLMGLFYYWHSVALIEDLPLEHHYDDPKVFFAEADKAYSQVDIAQPTHLLAEKGGPIDSSC